MASAPDISYITTTEVISETLLTNGLKELLVAEMTKLIKKAESQIDAYCGRQKHHPDDDNIDRVFPREIDYDEDGNSEIPYQVHEATLLQVEHLFTNWYNVDVNSEAPEQHQVKSYGVTGDGGYNETRTGAGRDDVGAQLSSAARARLKGFVDRTRRMRLSESGAVGFTRLSSREPIV